MSDDQVCLPPMNKGRLSFGATAHSNGKIIVAGGCDFDSFENPKCIGHSSVEEYDPGLKEWRSISNMTRPRIGCAVVCVNGKTYAIGGVSRRDGTVLKSVESFSTGHKKWKYIPAMKYARKDFVACTVHDKIYVMGGAANLLDDTVEVFNIQTQKWSMWIPKMPTRRHLCAAVAVGEKIFVFGGYEISNGSINHHASADVLDTSTNTWSSLPPMSRQRSGCTAAAVGNKIFVIGGWDGFYLQTSCELYDITTNTWSSIPNMTVKRHGCKAVTIGNKIYVMGGKCFEHYDSNSGLCTDPKILSSMEVLVIGETTSPRSTLLQQDGRKRSTNSTEQPTHLRKRLRENENQAQVRNTMFQSEENVERIPCNQHRSLIENENPVKEEQETELHNITQPSTEPAGRIVSPQNQDAATTSSSSAETIHERVTSLEETASALRERIEKLENDFWGEISSNGDSIVKRIERLANEITDLNDITQQSNDYLRNIVSPTNQDLPSKRIHERVTMLEERASSLRRRIEKLESDFWGEISSNGDSIVKRIEILETEFSL